MFKWAAIAVLVIASNMLPANKTVKDLEEVINGRNGSYTVENVTVSYQSEAMCTLEAQNGSRLGVLCSDDQLGQMLKVRLHKQGTFSKLIKVTPAITSPKPENRVIAFEDRPEEGIVVVKTPRTIHVVSRDKVHATNSKNMYVTEDGDIINN